MEATQRIFEDFKLTIWDNNTMISDYQVSECCYDGVLHHHLEVYTEICDPTDLILFLREDQFNIEDINASDYYQFNSYEVRGSFIFDLVGIEY